MVLIIQIKVGSIIQIREVLIIKEVLIKAGSTIQIKEDSTKVDLIRTREVLIMEIKVASTREDLILVKEDSIIQTKEDSTMQTKEDLIKVDLIRMPIIKDKVKDFY